MTTQPKEYTGIIALIVLMAFIPFAAFGYLCYVNGWWWVFIAPIVLAIIMGVSACRMAKDNSHLCDCGTPLRGGVCPNCGY